MKERTFSGKLKKKHEEQLWKKFLKTGKVKKRTKSKDKKLISGKFEV